MFSSALKDDSALYAATCSWRVTLLDRYDVDASVGVS